MKRVVKTLGTMGLVGCAAMNSPFAIAEDAGWYIGGNVGQSRATIDDARITAQLVGIGPATIVDDNRDTGYKLFGGYQLSENFAIEGGYFDLGQFGYTATIPAPTAGTLTGKIKLKGVYVDAVGIMPITEQFSVFGRLGLNYAQARDNFTNTGLVPVPANPNPSQNGTNYKFGMGLQYNFTPAFGMRLEAERYRIDDAVGNKGDVDLISLGLIYRFGAEKPAPAPVARVAEPMPVAAAPSAKSATVTPPPQAPKKAIFYADTSADALFGFGRAEITPGGARALDRFAADLKGARYEVITVTGHTDRLGPQKYNLKLSTQRAEAVKNYLVESAGIPADKIVARGINGAEPVTKQGECVGSKATEELKACLAPDRRVEVEVSATRASR